MKSVRQITAVVFFELAISPVVIAQAVNKDKERADNERDLEDIVELSGQIQKSSEQMKKNTENSKQ